MGPAGNSPSPRYSASYFLLTEYTFSYMKKITNTLWFKQDPKSNLSFRMVAVFGRYILKLFSVGLAAWLGSAGILLYHFYTINPLTSIWTVIVFPFVAGILILGYLKIILSFLLPSSAALLGVIVNLLSDFLIWLVKLFAQVDISQILIEHISLTPIVFYYVFILFAGFVHFRRPLIKKVICTVTVLLMIAFLGVTKWQRTHQDNLIMTCLDVGHGQAILAQLPGGANALFDAGSLSRDDVGRRIVCPFLDYIGISKIDAIIISHNDVDHINGIPEIAEFCKVGGVYANKAFFGKTDQWGTARFLEESLSKKGLEIQLLGEELNLQGSARIKIIWPNEKICADSTLSDNDKSVVCLIEFAGRRILLCSDIEKFAQKELLRMMPNLEADVVVVPHHSLAKTLEGDFIGSLGADILICSCGRRDYEKQQLTEAKNNAKLFYTAEDGAITVRIDNDGTIKSRTQPRSR